MPIVLFISGYCASKKKQDYPFQVVLLVTSYRLPKKIQLNSRPLGLNAVSSRTI